MLPKELFLSTLEKIQKQEARIDEFNTALSKICDGFPVFGFGESVPDCAPGAAEIHNARSI